MKGARKLTNLIVLAIFIAVSVLIGFFLYGANKEQTPVARWSLFHLTVIYGSSGLISGLCYIWMSSIVSSFFWSPAPGQSGSDITYIWLLGHTGSRKRKELPVLRAALTISRKGRLIDSAKASSLSLGGPRETTRRQITIFHVKRQHNSVKSDTETDSL